MKASRSRQNFKPELLIYFKKKLKAGKRTFILSEDQISTGKQWEGWLESIEREC